MTPSHLTLFLNGLHVEMKYLRPGPGPGYYLRSKQT